MGKISSLCLCFHLKGLKTRAPRLGMAHRGVINTLLDINKGKKNSTTSEVSFLYFVWWRVMRLQSIFYGTLWLPGTRRQLSKQIPKSPSHARSALAPPGSAGGPGLYTLPAPADCQGTSLGTASFFPPPALRQALKHS